MAEPGPTVGTGRRFCGYCGALREQGLTFCEQCGRRVDGSAGGETTPLPRSEPTRPAWTASAAALVTPAMAPLLCAIAMVVSLIFPWATVSESFYGVSMSGLAMLGNVLGWPVAGAAVAAVILAWSLASRPALARTSRAKYLAVAFIVGLAAAAVILIALMVGRSQQSLASALASFLGLSPGIGLYAYIIATLIGLLSVRRLWRLARG